MPKTGVGIDTAESGSQKGRNAAPSQNAPTARASKRKAAAPPALHTTLVIPAQTAAQLHPVQQSDDSDAIFPFRTNAAVTCGDVKNVFGEESCCETVSSINPDLVRSQTEARNSQVKHLDSSLPKRVSVDTANSASSFSKTKNASIMFSPTDN